MSSVRHAESSHIGLGILALGLLNLLLVVGLMLLLLLLGGPGRAGARVLGGIILGLTGIGVLGILVGQIMCILVPEESRARGFVVASFCCGSVGVLITFMASDSVNQMVNILGSLLTLTGYAMLIAFIRKVNVHLESGDGVRSSTQLLIYVIAVPILSILAGLILSSQGWSRKSFLVWMLGTQVATLIGFLITVVLAFRLRSTIGRLRMA